MAVSAQVMVLLLRLKRIRKQGRKQMREPMREQMREATIVHLKALAGTHPHWKRTYEAPRERSESLCRTRIYARPRCCHRINPPLLCKTETCYFQLPQLLQLTMECLEGFEA